MTDQQSLTQQRLSYQSLSPDSAAMLGDCIRRVYGDTYPLPEYYQSAYVAELLEKDLLHSELALNAAGEAVGTISTQLEQVGDISADGTMTMVDQAYRGHRVLYHLGLRMAEVYQQLNIAGLQLYALALHHIVQQQAGDAGAVVTGILPTYFSQGANMSGFDSGQARVGAVVMHMPLAALPESAVYLPQVYKDPLQRVYRELDLARISNASAGRLASGTSQLLRDEKSGNGLLRLRFDSLAADFPTLVSQAQANPGFEVTYLDLPLADAAVEEATAIARDMGFFYGSLILNRCGSDRLRLQHYRADLYDERNLMIASDSGKALRDFVLQDAS